jgi:hypothetical protein
VEGFKDSIEECFRKKGLSNDNLLARVDWICESFKAWKERTVDKKKKMVAESETKPKAKYELNRDSAGQVVFPIHVNQSLRLLAIGSIVTHPNYHSEHNLFPVGFRTVRVHASMFRKGQKCEYTC